MVKTLASGDSAAKYVSVNKRYGMSYKNGASVLYYVQTSLPADPRASMSGIRTKHATTGPLARIGPNHLLTSDPSTMQKILAVRSKYTRSAWYDSLRLDPHRSNLVTERDTQKHNVRRHQLAPGV